MRERAPAKLNLYLHITGRREDHYHRLDSLVAFTELGDELWAAPAAALSLDVQGPFGSALADQPENLVLKAARVLAAAAGCEPHAALTLVKTLPPASGIGGGSADAAATLRALQSLWGLSLPASSLAEIAQGLGADVPACLASVPVQMAGIGEVLRPAPRLPRLPLLLVHPGLPLATADVFGAFRGPFSAPSPLEAAPQDAHELGDALRARRNDLATTAIALCPVIGQVLAALNAQPGALLARMSGSGATCFALFGAAAAADDAAASLRREYPAWWVQVTALGPAFGE